jgi:hypothetical protein
MTVRIFVLQHEPETGLGRFGELLADSRVEYEIVSTLGPLPDALAVCRSGRTKRELRGIRPGFKLCHVGGR